MKIRGLVAILAVSLAGSTGALAHAYPKTESPAKGSTVKVAPKLLWIDFDDELEPHFTGMAVTNAAGAHVDIGMAAVSPKDSRHLSIALKPLQAGTYTVTWHAVDTDTHRTHGSYIFTVAP
jgi:methionine-rich copper-binding protein CopC